MHREQLNLLERLQALEFTAVDFNLYLNTHPGDGRAFTDYVNTVRELQQLRQVYIRNYGPLTPMDVAEQPCWNWTQEPWPWQIDY